MAQAKNTKVRKMNPKNTRTDEWIHRSLLDSLSLGIVIADHDRKVKYVNPKMESLLGMSEKEIKKKPLDNAEWKFIRPDGSPFPAEEYPSVVALREQTSVQDEEAGFVRENGEIVWLRGSADILPDESGVLISLMDISDMKNAKKALQEKREMLQAVMESTHDSVALIDTDGTIRMINTSAARRFGKKTAEMAGKKVYEFLPEKVAKSREKRFKEVIEKKKHVMFVDTREGRTYENHIYPVLNDKGEVFCLSIFGRDITEQRQAEEALEKAKTEVDKRIEKRTEKLKEREENLLLQTYHLKEVNNALNVLLERRDKEKKELEDNIMNNVQELVIPYLEKLKNSTLSNDQKTTLGILESNLNHLVSPFIQKMSSKYLNFTPMEIRVANLVKEGKSNKEIAEFLKVSKHTILTHRHNLRKKLGLKNKKINLRTHLISFD